ncbi:hypothetical protein D3C74_175990 [compost metagenome]
MTKNRGKVIKSILIVFSLIIFVYYLKLNFRESYYDEAGYLNLSKLILSNGLFNVNEPLRTYFYPLIISILSIFTNGNVLFIKILVSLFQYLIYLYTILKIAKVFYKQFNHPLVYYSILFFGLTNLYLIQSTTLFLTDLLASCTIILAILSLMFDDLNSRINFKPFSLIFISIMIRPSSMIILPIAFIILFIRKKIMNDVKISIKLLVSLMLPSIIILPQLYNNVMQFNHWTPLIHANLYEFQSNLAATYLKYGTVIMPNEEAALVFKTPFEIGDNTSIFGLITENPFAFLVTYLVHLFGVLDWGYVDTYIKDYYPFTRIPASLLLYFFWILSVYGFCAYKRSSLDANKKKYISLALPVTFLIYWFFLGTTVVEARFGYPLFLFVLPFAGLGTAKILLRLKQKFGSFGMRGYLIGLLWVLILLVILFFSFLLDSTTGRIKWI